MELLSFLPSIVSTISGLFSGNQAQNQNNQVRADQQAINQQQQQYFNQADALNTTNNTLLFGGDNSNVNFSPNGGMSLGDILRQYNSGMGGQMDFLNGLKGQYGGLNAGYQGLGQGLNGLDAGYQGLASGLSSLDPAYQGLSGRLDGIDGQYGGLAQLLSGLSGKYDALGGQFQGLDSQYAQQGNSLGNLIAQLGGQGTHRADTTGMQDALMQSGRGLMASLNPDAYRNQARLSGQDAMSQINADLGARGVGNGGISGQLAARSLSRLYADADSKLNADRLQGANIANNAYGQAGQLNISTAGTNNAAQQNFGQLMASLIGQQGNMTGARAGLLGQQAGLIGAQAGLNNQQAGLLGARAGLNNQQAGLLGARAGLNGQQANMLGARAGLNNQQAGLLGAQGGLLNQQQGLGQLLASLFGQMSGVQSGIVGQQIAGNQFQQNQALNQAQIKGGQAASLNQNINPNPNAGLTAGINSVGTAIGNYQNQQAQAPLQQAMADYYKSLIPTKPVTRPAMDVFGNPVFNY